MEQHEQEFEEFFQKRVLAKVPKLVELLLNDLRRRDSKAWMEMAQSMMKLGSYDRVERTKEAADDIGHGLEELLRLINARLPRLTMEFLINAEKHFVNHGQELDELARKHGAVKDVTPRAAVEDLLRNMKGWKPD